MKKLFILKILTVFILFGMKTAFAQNSPTLFEVKGRIADKDNNSIVTTLFFESPNLKKDTMTDDSGAFSIRLPKGLYKISIGKNISEKFSQYLDIKENSPNPLELNLKIDVNPVCCPEKPANTDTLLKFLTDDGITGAVKDKIIRHIKENLSKQTVQFILSNNEQGEKDLIVSEDGSVPFADSVKFYSLHSRRFFHWSEVYVEFNGRLYTSLKTGDFENFLRDYDFINKADSLNLFIAAYRNFNTNGSAIHPDYVVTEKYLRENRKNLTEYEAGYPKLFYKQLHSPKAKKQKQSIEISFFLDNPLLEKITLQKVVVSSNYSFQWKSKIFRRRKPVETN